MVIEVANWAAAPAAGALLADLGAEVIKIESPQGDSMRYTLRQVQTPEHKPFKPGSVMDYAYQMVNRGKRSVALDIQTEEGVSEKHPISQSQDGIGSTEALRPLRFAACLQSLDVFADV